MHEHSYLPDKCPVEMFLIVIHMQCEANPVHYNHAIQLRLEKVQAKCMISFCLELLTNLHRN